MKECLREGSHSTSGKHVMHHGVKQVRHRIQTSLTNNSQSQTTQGSHEVCIDLQDIQIPALRISAKGFLEKIKSQVPIVQVIDVSSLNKDPVVLMDRLDSSMHKVRRWVCNDCNEIFNDHSLLVQHKKSRHLVPVGRHSSVPQEAIKVPIGVLHLDLQPQILLERLEEAFPQMQAWKCKDCDLRFKCYESYFSHRQREHPFEDGDEEVEEDISVEDYDDCSFPNTVKSSGGTYNPRRRTSVKRRRNSSYRRPKSQINGRHKNNKFTWGFKKPDCVPIPHKSQLKNQTKTKNTHKNSKVEQKHSVVDIKTSKLISDSCKRCGQHFDDDKILCQHLRYDHFEVEKSGRKNDKTQRQESSSSSSDSFTCDLCKQMKHFTHSWQFAWHRRRYHDIQETVVDGKVVQLGSKPAKYERYQGEKYICDVCGMSVNNLEKHVLSKHEKTKLPFPCDQCDASYYYCNELLRHRRRKHLGLIPTFTCKYCNKKFRDDYAFKMHVEKQHEGKRLRCRDCEDTFATRDQLYQHELSRHKKNRPFECQFCQGLRFVQKTHWKNHLSLLHKKEVESGVKLDPTPKKIIVPEEEAQEEEEEEFTGQEETVADPDPFNLQLETINFLDEAEIWDESIFGDVTTSGMISNETNIASNTNNSDLTQVTSVTDILNPFAAACTMSLSFGHQHQTELYQPIIPVDHQYQETTVGETSYATLTPLTPTAIFFGSQPTVYQVINTSCLSPSSTSLIPPSSPTHSVQQLQVMQPLSGYQATEAVILTPGECKVCVKHFDDVKSHYLYFHKLTVEVVDKLMS